MSDPVLARSNETTTAVLKREKKWIWGRRFATAYCGAVSLVSMIYIALSLYGTIAKIAYYKPHGAGYPCFVGYAIAFILPVLGVHLICWLIGSCFVNASAIRSRVYIGLGIASFVASVIAMGVMVAFC